MTGAGWVLGIDPGAVHTGVVLCRVGTTLDRTGVPELEPLDGLTIHRNPDEDPVRVGGLGAYAARAAAEILDLLDLHGVQEEQVSLVCIEGYTLPSGWVSHQAMVDSVQLNRVLGYLEATWPEHQLVAPAGTWPGGRTGWDADPEPVPECLTGRRPATWSQGAGSRGTHQRSAYCMARAGWRKWCAQMGTSSASAPAVPVSEPVAVAVPEAAQRRFGEAELVADRSKVRPRTCSEPMGVAVPRLTLVQQVVERVNAGGVTSVTVLLDAATQTWPEGTTSDRVALAVAAAMALRPETNRERMQARLEAKAAELKGTPAEN